MRAHKPDIVLMDMGLPVKDGGQPPPRQKRS